MNAVRIIGFVRHVSSIAEHLGEIYKPDYGAMRIATGMSRIMSGCAGRIVLRNILMKIVGGMTGMGIYVIRRVLKMDAGDLATCMSGGMIGCVRIGVGRRR